MHGQDVSLVCFPHAGGSNATYNAWGARLGPGIRRLRPGCFDSHGQRAGFSTLDGLALHIAGQLAGQPAPLVFYGHSMGAILAYEVARLLARDNPRQVAHLFVSGRRAPQLAARLAPVHQLADHAFIEALRAYGGVPAAFDGNSRLLHSLVPVIRADLALVETYGYTPHPPLQCPITAIHATDDRVVVADELMAWQHRTCAAFEFQACDGGHFFHVEQPQRLVDLLQRSFAGPLDRSVACAPPH